MHTSTLMIVTVDLDAASEDLSKFCWIAPIILDLDADSDNFQMVTFCPKIHLW